MLWKLSYNFGALIFPVSFSNFFKRIYLFIIILYFRERERAGAGGAEEKGERKNLTQVDSMLSPTVGFDLLTMRSPQELKPRVSGLTEPPRCPSLSSFNWNTLSVHLSVSLCLMAEVTLRQRRVLLAIAEL